MLPWPQLPSTCDSLKAGQFSLGFGAGGRLPIWHGVGGFTFNSSSSQGLLGPAILATEGKPTADGPQGSYTAVSQGKLTQVTQVKFDPEQHQRSEAIELLFG